MYKLLIVDDECLITDLLYEYLLQKLEDDLEIVKAYTSRGAAALIKETKIDILLTDINMPGISGLDLHRIAKEANAYCKVIFLTGYNNFANIQYALRNESVDFILKTESNEVICHSVIRAVQALDHEMKLMRQALKAKQQLELTLPILHERLILSLLDGEAVDRERFSEIDFPLSPTDPILMLLGRMDNGHSLAGKDLYRLKHLVDESVGEHNKIFSIIERSDILWLIQPGRLEEEATLKAVRAGMDAVHRMCVQEFNVSMSLVLSEGFVPFSDISFTWQGLKQTIKNFFGLSSGMLLIENNTQLKQSGMRAEWLNIRNVLQEIRLCVDSLQREGYERYYGELTRLIQGNPHLTHAEMMEIFFHLCLSFLSNANNSGLCLDIPMETHFDGGDWSRYDRLFETVSKHFFESQHQNSFRNTNALLSHITHYIKANLGGDVSLNKLAEISHFNPSYLSRLFKQVTNVSLSDYIGRLKFERATQLLVNSDMKIADIAMSLGFETQSYFTRFFKKRAQIGPQEYRETYGK